MLVLQIRHINQGDQLPTVEQSHAVANFLHLVQVVGREQDGLSYPDIGRHIYKLINVLLL